MWWPLDWTPASGRGRLRKHAGQGEAATPRKRDRGPLNRFPYCAGSALAEHGKGPMHDLPDNIAQGTSAAQDPRGGPLLDTPLSRLRQTPYAWLHRDLIAGYGEGKGWHLVTLAALASLIRRKGRSLGLDDREFAESTGLHEKVARQHLLRFRADGLAERDGEAWRPSDRLRRLCSTGHRALIRFRNLPALVAAIGGSGFRHMCWDRLHTFKATGRRVCPVSRLAEAMGRDRTTAWRGNRTLRDAGIGVGRRFRGAGKRIATSLRRELQRASRAVADGAGLGRRASVKPAFSKGFSEKAADVGKMLGRAMPSGGAAASEASCNDRRRHLKAQAAALGATC